MSTRWYPIYRAGNPQLRIFLPNFWLKLVNIAKRDYPKNIIHFECSMEMSSIDVRNYLEKIYKIPVVEVTTEVVEGTLRRCPGQGYIIKDDDYKLAKVILPKSEKFVFPEIYPEEINPTTEENKIALKESKEKEKAFTNRNNLRPDVPGWFSF